MVLFCFYNRPNVFKILIPQNLCNDSSKPYKSPQLITTISLLHYMINAISNYSLCMMPINPQAKLRRLPHVFSQVLELPLRSHADVIIEDRSDCFRFTANIANSGFVGAVRAHAVKIYPGVTKVVIREGNGNGEVLLWLDKLEVDVWRFRFPDVTRPDLATAVVMGTKLIVTVPKGGGSCCGRKVGVVAKGGLYL